MALNKEQALSKIRKCLALAKSSNPHEAAAALRQAQKLMAVFGVTDTDARLADVTEAPARAASNAVTPWEAVLSDMIAEAFGCESYTRVGRDLTASFHVARRRDYVFVGVGPAPQIASYAYGVLARQCARDRLAHIRAQPKSCKPITKTARGDQFALGWVYGVRKLVESFYGDVHDQELIEQYMAERYPDMLDVKAKDRSKGRNVSHNDMAQGHAAGKQAQLNRGIDGMAQQGLLT